MTHASSPPRRSARGVALFLTCSWMTAAAPSAAQSDAEPLVPRTNKPRVELVFVLDTTGSMSGLIDGAKRKVWAIASEVRRAQQQPDVKIGLVAFRDQGDAYVTKVTPLTSNVDQVYGDLMQLSADGGGDTPEDVNAGLRAAIEQMPWSSGPGVLKLIFLVGDAPPHMDYPQAVLWPSLVKRAVLGNIYVNAVQCGQDADTTRVWKEIAHAAEGRYALIPQDGGVAVAVVTPFDADLAGLARELDRTYLDYGDSASRFQRKTARAGAGSYAASGPASTAADRAAFKASVSANASDDLVALADAAGGVDRALARVKPAELPDELRGKAVDEQRAILAKAVGSRAQLTAAIADLEKKRAAYLAAKRGPAGGDAFDAEVIEMVKTQGAKAGLTY
jgi:Mg-chelatase subunit ChlD